MGRLSTPDKASFLIVFKDLFIPSTILRFLTRAQLALSHPVVSENS